MSKKVGIILVNYKDYVNRFLSECRDSLRKQDYSDFIVYIVDNASSEESREYIKKNYLEARIIQRLDGNYSAANNIGIKKAEEDGCEYFVIANMDTRFKNNWLSELVYAIESDNSIGMAQSKILLYPKTEKEWQKSKINSVGNIMNFLGFGFTSGYNEDDREIEGYPEIKGYVSGCSYITKKEVIKKIGNYNEEYFMYHDDVEMSWKAKLAGYKIVLAPKSVVYHKYEFGRSILMLYYIERNRYIAVLSFYSLPSLILLLPALIAMDIGMFLYSISGGWFKIKLRVYVYFLRLDSWRKILENRKYLKSIRKIEDKKIVDSFVGKIMFQEVANPVLEYVANPIFNLYWRIIKRIIFW